MVFWFSFDIKREQSALMKKRSAPRTGARRWCFSGSLLARKRELSSPQKQFINIKRPSSSLHENLKVFLCIEDEVLCALVARGMFFFWSNGLRSARARGRAGFFFKLVLAPVARGSFFSCGQVACAPRGPEAGRGVSNPPSLPLDSTLPATS